MRASSYGNSTVSSGKVKISQNLEYDIEGRDVIIVDDMMDTGNTINGVYNFLLKQKPKSLKTCFLADKDGRRDPNVKIVPDYYGYKVVNEYLAGYGMNVGDECRDLPFIGIVKFKKEKTSQY